MPPVMWLGQPESMTLPHSVQEAQSKPPHHRLWVQGWGSRLACTMVLGPGATLWEGIGGF